MFSPTKLSFPFLYQKRANYFFSSLHPVWGIINEFLSPSLSNLLFLALILLLFSSIHFHGLHTGLSHLSLSKADPQHLWTCPDQECSCLQKESICNWAEPIWLCSFISQQIYTQAERQSAVANKLGKPEMEWVRPRRRLTLFWLDCSSVCMSAYTHLVGNHGTT